MELELTSVVKSTVQTRRKPLLFALTLQENLEELPDKFVMNDIICNQTHRWMNTHHRHRY